MMTNRDYELGYIAGMHTAFEVGRVSGLREAAAIIRASGYDDSAWPGLAVPTVRIQTVVRYCEQGGIK